MYTIDGQLYEKKEDAPDLGSLRCVAIKGSRRFYMGLAADSFKLPKYDSLGTGSYFRALDTGIEKMYNASTKEWYLQPASGGGGGSTEDYAEVDGDLEPFTPDDWENLFFNDDSSSGGSGDSNDEFGGNIDWDDFFS